MTETERRIEQLADAVIARLSGAGPACSRILAITGREMAAPAQALGERFPVDLRAELPALDGYDCVILPAARLRELLRETGAAPPKSTTAPGNSAAVDLTGHRVIHERLLAEHCIGAAQVRVSPAAVITPLARDYLREHGITLLRGNEATKLL